MWYGVAVGTGVFLLFGFVTGLIPNSLYIRMVPRTPVDYLFLTLTALLSGVYTAQRLASETAELQCANNGSDSTVGEQRLAFGGLVGGFLAVGCPICNVFLLTLFSSSALMTYFDPFRPFLGGLSVAMLFGLIYVRHCRLCSSCTS